MHEQPAQNKAPVTDRSKTEDAAGAVAGALAGKAAKILSSPPKVGSGSVSAPGGHIQVRSLTRDGKLSNDWIDPKGKIKPGIAK